MLDVKKSKQENLRIQKYILTEALKGTPFLKFKTVTCLKR